MPKNSKSAFRIAFESQKARTSQKVRAYLLRRPHRSFRLTKRRDFVRTLRIPGVISMTVEVTRVLWGHKKLFLGVAAVYAVLFILLIGVGSQETYAQLSQTLRETSGGLFQGNWGELQQAGLLFTSLATTGLGSGLAIEQQIYSVILALLVWLTTIWLLRHILGQRPVKLRDGLYNAGAPIVATFLIALVMIVQLLPAALAGIGYGAASASGLLQGGVEAMLFWIAAGCAILLSLYWVTSTFFAMVIVTLPGTYPLQALRTAGDMVVGRRVRILLRILWALCLTAFVWAIILIPVILFDSWIKSVWSAIQWMPLVPVTLLILTTVGLLWSTAYVYILYRKVIDDDAAPA